MATPIRTEPGHAVTAASRPSWAVMGPAMTRHLEWLEVNAGRHATRDVVDGALLRLEHQLHRLESGATAARLVAAATTLRDCGALLGNAELARRAATLLDASESEPGRVGELTAGLVDEGRRTSSWLRIWRALSTPASPARLLARQPGGNGHAGTVAARS